MHMPHACIHARTHARTFVYVIMQREKGRDRDFTRGRRQNITLPGATLL